MQPAKKKVSWEQLRPWSDSMLPDPVLTFPSHPILLLKQRILEKPVFVNILKTKPVRQGWGHRV